MSDRMHLRNLGFNWGGHAATLLVMFFLSPYIIGKLDAVTYGVWSLLSVLTGYMGIFDLGARASVGRHVALYLGKGDHEAVDETIRTGFGFFTITGGGVLMVGVALGWLFPTFFQSVPQEHYDTVRYLLPLMVINVWLSAIAAIYSSILAAHDRFDVARSVDFFTLIVRTAGTIYVLHNGWGLWGLALALIVSNVCAVAGNRYFAGSVHKGLRSFPLLYKKSRLAELCGYGFAAFIVSASVKIVGQSNLVVVGITLSVADVREYSVGAMLIYYSATFIKIIARTFFPAVQRAIAGDNFGEARHLFFRQMQLSLILGLLVYVGYVFYSKIFIGLWMLQDSFGPESVIASGKVMSVLALASLPLLFINPCQSVLAAAGHVKYNAVVSLVEAFANVALSLVFVLVFHWGLLGVAFGTLVARLLLPAVFTPYLFCRVMKVSGLIFFERLIWPALISVLLFSMVCFSLTQFWPPTSWGAFGLNVVFACMAWALISFVLLCPKDIKAKYFPLIARA